MAKILRSVTAVIDALGGPTKTGKRFGVVPGAVCNWRANDRFPERLHLSVYLELKKEGRAIDPALIGQIGQLVQNPQGFIKAA